MAEGTIIKGLGGFYFVQSGKEIYSCSLRGRLRKREEGVLAGDRVVFSPLGIDQGVAKGVVEDILPRQNELIRPRIANVKQGLIILAAADPDPDFSLLDRLLILMQKAGIKPAVCFNKIDLAASLQPLEAARAAYEAAGFPVIFISAYQKVGREVLRQLLQDTVTVIAGPSGAGKSSTLNMLQPGLCLETGMVSEKLGRGKHTTRVVELLPLDFGGWVADSPGFSRLDLPQDMMPEDLPGFYPDFFQPEKNCRFDGCLHDQEPECGVKQAAAAGVLSKGRYERYQLLLKELQERELY